MSIILRVIKVAQMVWLVDAAAEVVQYDLCYRQTMISVTIPVKIIPFTTLEPWEDRKRSTKPDLANGKRSHAYEWFKNRVLLGPCQTVNHDSTLTCLEHYQV